MAKLNHAQRARLNGTLQRVFGHERMRDAQEPVIATVFAGRNAGFDWRTSTAAPETTAAAMLVPLISI